MRLSSVVSRPSVAPVRRVVVAVLTRVLKDAQLLGVGANGKVATAGVKLRRTNRLLVLEVRHRDEANRLIGGVVGVVVVRQVNAVLVASVLTVLVMEVIGVRRG